MVSKLDLLIDAYHSPECEFNAEKSIEICKEILKIEPDFIEFQENLASSYYQKRDYEKSIELFFKCIENGAQKDYSYFMIALSYVRMNEREKALKIIGKSQDKDNYLMNHFRIYYELNEYDKALEYGDKFLERNPEDRMALHIMSDIYASINDVERSMFYFSELSNIVPQIKSIELTHLESYGKYNEVIESFEELKTSGIFDHDLESPLFNYVIGHSYYELNKPYESLKYLIESDRLFSTVEKKILIAKNYMNLLKFDYAHKYLKEGLKIDELNEDCLFLICETSYYLQDYIKAVEYANKLLKNHSCNKVFHILAAIYFDLGDNHNAYESLKVGTHLMIEEWDYEKPYREYIFEIASRLSKAGYSKRAENILNLYEKKHPEY